MRLGIANVDRLARSLTARQLMEWEAYAELEPFDERRADYRTASIVQTIANVNRGKNQKPYTLEEMLLKFGEQPKKRQQSPEEQMRILNLLAHVMAVDPK